IAINGAWSRFACENAGNGLTRTGVGANYLEVCGKAAADGAPHALRALAGIQEVMAGFRQHFTTEYDCHSPEKERWFVMSVTPRGVSGLGAVISHSDITERVLAEKASQS